MDFLELLKAVLFGIVQGITEWLPISSTGHMILLDELVQLNCTPDFWNMFLVVIQFGSILAVLCLYFHKLNPFSSRKSGREKKETLSLWAKVIVGVVPAGIIGVLFNDKIEQLLMNSYVVAFALIGYGVMFIVIENRKRQPSIQNLQQLNYSTALWIGVFQILSLIPGTSRSGSTILGAVLLGCSRQIAAEFSFFLAVPVMLGASGLKLVKHGLAYQAAEWGILIAGMVTAFLVSIAAIRFLTSFIKKHDFKVFGYYRIGLGILVLLFFWMA